MSCCEKCWSDAYIRMLCNSESLKTQADHYRELLEERKDRPFSEADKKGQNTDKQ